jgi:hypothetical protein
MNLSGNPTDYSFEDYLTSSEPSDNWAVDNVAVRMFSGSMDCSAKSDQDWHELLLLAKDRIGQLNFVGFHESINSDIHTLCENIGISSKQVGRKRITQKARIVEDSPSLSAEILKCTKWDKQLYEFAKSHFLNSLGSEK